MRITRIYFDYWFTSVLSNMDRQYNNVFSAIDYWSRTTLTNSKTQTGDRQLDRSRQEGAVFTGCLWKEGQRALVLLSLTFFVLYVLFVCLFFFHSTVLVPSTSNFTIFSLFGTSFQFIVYVCQSNTASSFRKSSKQRGPTCYGALVFTLDTNFFSFTLLFWNQMVICRSDRPVTAEIFLLLSLVMNLLAPYSFSSSFSWTLVYGIRFFLPRRKGEPSCWWATTSVGQGTKRQRTETADWVRGCTHRDTETHSWCLGW